jgi:2,3-dihydroxybenzoate-AMP ligase
VRGGKDETERCKPGRYLRGFTPWPDELAARYRAAGYWTGETLGGMLRRAADAHPGRLAVVCGDRRWSYAQLDERCDRLAAGLHRLGIRAHDRVVVQLPNVAEFYVVCFALFRIGALPVLALPAHRRAEIG